ncbi:MAG: 5-methyltetrahydropteroyltriglutamate--homocysteine S-methyltransferase [Thermaerobacter sp.]|nr:5-methyltetrahydropteroyltriglutamate--homocysteine S-methyltransferase [Thermaerobacter sp.]
MATSLNLGFPRIGARRELKRATEDYWAGRLDAAGLEAAGAQIRAEHWRLQMAAGIESIPVGDFSFYDQVLDAAALVGAVPERYRALGDASEFPAYFALARGVGGEGGLAPLEMTKWFDTNYHYIVPEYARTTKFRLQSARLLGQLREAQGVGAAARPVLLGPVSLLRLGKSVDAGLDPLDLLPQLLPVYAELLEELQAAGASFVQIDEPIFAMDLTDAERAALRTSYAVLREGATGLRVLLASYFASYGDDLPLALSLPVDALHLDLVRAPQDLKAALRYGVPQSMQLSLGVVDGRNIWRTDLRRALAVLEEGRQALSEERILVAPSCSLLHVPIDLDLEMGLDPELQGWLSFANQKLSEVTVLAAALSGGEEAAAQAFESNERQRALREASPRSVDPAVRKRLASLKEADGRRQSPGAARRKVQEERLPLPPLPTTTIGSFPQTEELRSLRARKRRNELSQEEYEAGIRAEIARVIRLQEEIGLDLLVHGEAERNDMVEYFGEQLEGFAATQNGWVQSYGTRCVKPPIIFGDVHRPQPMTVRWSAYAQSLTTQPVKGMLTGPVTILQWSFARDDQPRELTAKQIALAIRDEVQDLEAAGIRAIQIDEPAFREGLPLRAAEREDYLRWATEAFRLATSGVEDETQIHSHMCYSEFNDIVEAIAALDADVISIEAARSGMELLEAFSRFSYPNEIGPGVYDIHSPRVPDKDEMVKALRAAAGVLGAGMLWVNPDCGLKTRRFEEAVPALRNMVAAARQVREE